MPIYEYRCRDCGEALEVRQAFTDDALTECPHCKGSLRKIFSTTTFRGLLAEAVARSFYAMSGGDPVAFTDDPALDPFPGDHQVAFDALRMQVPWVDCPTCAAKGFDPITANDCGTGLIEYLTCPTCSGTGKATVAQLLAWGQAIADPIDSHGLSGDDDYEAVVWYRNRILDVQP